MTPRVARLAAALLALCASPALAQKAGPLPLPAADEASVRQKMLRTIRAFEREKAGRTRAERKIASRLLYGVRMRRGEPAVEGVARTPAGVRWDHRGTTEVDITARVTPQLLEAIAALGGRVVSAHPRFDAVRAHLSADGVERLAARDDVRGIRPADRPVRRKDNTSQGDVAHRADDLRGFAGVDGTGVTVGVLSDGVDTLAARQATGDLPPVVTVLPGQSGSGDEGTAMLEIVHDLAPGASLMFATAFGGQPTFATNILDLAAAGADVIVDDIGYFTEAVFQDGPVAEAVEDVTAAGVLYVSAAGNDGNQNAATSGVYEGDFVDSGASYAGGLLHEFAPNITDTFIDEDSEYLFALKWSDPLGGSGNDYDLYLFETDGTFSDSSVDVQDGDDDPVEAIISSGSCPSGCDHTDFRLAIVRFSGDARYLHLHTFGGELEFSTPGAIYGHPGANGAIAVAAVDWFFAGGPGGEFDGSESVELFSSDGPRRVFYQADGTPYTPGNFSSSGGELRAKPDVAGADGVSTAADGPFDPFFGTSAAAPHVAAVAALLFEHGGPGTTAADVRAALEGSALDIEAPGDDRDSGHGIVEAVAAATLLPEPGALPALAAGVLLVVVLARRRG